MSYHSAKIQKAFSLPDKVRISMREIRKSNGKGQIEIQERVKNSQTKLKQTQIAAVCSMHDLMQFVTQ